MQDATRFWNRLARRYAARPIGDSEAYERWLARLRTFLKPSDRVLEVGCGTGTTALLLGKNVAHVTATDFSQGMIEIAEERRREQAIGNVAFKVASVEDFAPEGTSYDAVLAFNLLHLVRDRQGAIAHLKSLLKPGGLFVSKTACMGGSGAPLKKAALWLLIAAARLVGKAPYVAFLDPSAFEREIAAQGFAIVEAASYPAGARNRFIVARKL